MLALGWAVSAAGAYDRNWSAGLAFLHVPKTGGSTIGEVLDEWMLSQSCALLRDCDAVQKLTSNYSRCTCFHIAGAGVLDCWDKAPHDTRAKDLRLIRGHFGIEHSFGSEILTVLRHPVDRFISSYFYVASGASNPLKSVGHASAKEQQAMFGTIIHFS